MELEFVGPSNISNPAGMSQLGDGSSRNAMMKEESAGIPILVSILNSASHPTVCLFQILFKLLAFASFLFGPFFFRFFSKNSFIMTFFLTVILLSLDFWTVKNVTGRILIGMRWWYEISKDGETIWMFENYSESKNTNKSISSNTDKSIFWVTTYAWTLLWIVTIIFQLLSLKFQWISLSAIAIALSFSNLIGYTKCIRSSKNIQKDWIANIAVKTIMSNAQNMV
ncbi:ransmembrane domain-containing protein [Cryptosporidium canis]|uniref:Golgi apparatus membrane protein TVP23 homolog n=1 Tax=Cryptosporidium canis TaxID=195482 RepID=A0ABQ8PAN2_9CRYT|nr:ransmembrane domain-containing protein [Cryptosporidium canis]KAJ1613945.1 ransmembrane domain-containing protein [Cryptosporidium canis]